MIKSIAMLVFSSVVVSGCAYSIKDIDTSKAEPSCVRECSHAYGTCAGSGPVVGFKTETLRACREAYEVCVNTCPMK